MQCKFYDYNFSDANPHPDPSITPPVPLERLQLLNLWKGKCIETSG